jgi:hypothetical protein
MSLESQLEAACLSIMAGTDNNQITAATKFLNTQAKNVTAIMPLHALLRHQTAGVRTTLRFFSSFFFFFFFGVTSSLLFHRYDNWRRSSSAR